jgi:hypothetical protein
MSGGRVELTVRRRRYAIAPDDLWDHVSGAGGEFALKGSLELSQRELDTRLAEARRIGALGENLFNDWLALRPEIGGLAGGQP